MRKFKVSIFGYWFGNRGIWFFYVFPTIEINTFEGTAIVFKWWLLEAGVLIYKD